MEPGNVAQGDHGDETSPAVDARFERLEIRHSEMELAQVELHEAMLAQMRQIERLERHVTRLEQRLESLGESASMPKPQDEIPPHY